MFTPDDFRGRPYGYVTNQISHATKVGFLGFVYWSCLVWFLVFGEIPVKWYIIVFAGVTYAAYELVTQRWRGWDTVEDWWVVVVYGVVMPVKLFDEVVPGSPVVQIDLVEALPWVAAFTVHLAVGSAYRWAQREG